MHQTLANQVYGMYSGLALLLDVHQPARSNGHGVVYINGSGWHGPLGLDAMPLKETPLGRPYIEAMCAAGYTVFAINHRAAPRHRYPAAIEDARRAVRFMRQHAERFGIRADRIGACGGSSGGHLVSLLGTRSIGMAPMCSAWSRARPWWTSRVLSVATAVASWPVSSARLIAARRVAPMPKSNAPTKLHRR